MRPSGHIGRRDEHGAVAIIFAIATTFLFVLAAMVVDLGLARDTRQQSQNTADASALAAANALYPTTGTCTAANPGGGSTSPCFTDAVNAAKTYALRNFNVSAAAWSACTDSGHYYVPAGYSPCVSFTDNTLTTSVVTAPTKVRVMVPTKNVHFGIGAVTGKSGVDIETMARVAVQASSNVTCAVCFLSSVNTTKFDLTVSGAAIVVNGDVTGNKGDWTASSIQVHVPANTDGHLNPSPAVTALNPYPVGDPWATRPGVVPAAAGTNKGTNSPCGPGASAGPGVYGSVDLPNSSCVLQAGIYVITGVWSAKNNTVLNGTAGVTLYFACGSSAAPRTCNSPGENGGWLDMKNGTLQITAPNTGDRVAIVYDRYNTSPFELQGNGNATAITGAVYAPSATVNFNGNSKIGIVGGPFIVKTATGNGTTGISLTSPTSATLATIPGAFALDQ